MRPKHNLRSRIAAAALTVLLGLNIAAPAIASGPLCGIEPHEHDEGCYLYLERGDLTCGREEIPVPHEHDGSCYGTRPAAACGEQERPAHRHDEGCYADVLACGLEEGDAEAPGDGFGDSIVEDGGEDAAGGADGSGDAAGDAEAGTDADDAEEAEGQAGDAVPEAMAEPHAHGAGCYERVLACGLTEDDGHEHGEACMADEEYLVCDRTDTEYHEHGDECYELLERISDEPLCGLIEHDHSFGCWFTDKSEDLEAFLEAYEAFAEANAEGLYDDDPDAMIAAVREVLGLYDRLDPGIQAQAGLPDMMDALRAMAEGGLPGADTMMLDSTVSADTFAVGNKAAAGTLSYRYETTWDGAIGTVEAEAGQSVRFKVEFPGAGTYSVNIICTTPPSDMVYVDQRTCTVTYSVDAQGNATEASRAFTLDGRKTGTQSAFVARCPMVSVWDDGTMDRAREIMEGMTLEEKVGQLFLIHYPDNGGGTAAQAKELIERWHPGGFLVFRNMFASSTPTVVAAKTSAAQADAIADTGVPMYFSVDEEGGTVVRISHKSNTYKFRPTPFEAQSVVAARGLQAVYDDAVEKSELLASLGLSVNHAPVADVSQVVGSFIYQRSYGGDGLYNARFVAAAIEAYNDNGIGSTMKHFPGYGATSSDTHAGFAVNDLPLAEFEYNDLLPFYEGMGAGGKAVMVTHNTINCMDTEMPASLSPAVISYLRNVMGFDGLVMTDDLEMQAITDAVGDGRASLACLEAGVDVAMTPHPETDIPVVMDAIASGELSMDRVEESCLRVLAWKIDMGLMDLDVDPDDPGGDTAEAEWTDGVDTAEGTFDEMWDKATANGGIVRLLTGCDTAGGKSVPAKDITLDLNGHGLVFTGGINGFVVNGSPSMTFTITDSVDPDASSEEVGEVGVAAGYNAVRHILTYYTTGEDGAITKHSVDFDASGIITGTNSGALVNVVSGRFTLAGGVLTHPSRAVETASNSVVINISGGGILGCGGISVARGGGIYLTKGTLGITGGYIGGNTANERGGGVYSNDSGNIINMSGGVIAANRANTAYGGGISTFTNNRINVSGGTIACNSVGGTGWGGGVYAADTSTISVSGGAHITMNEAVDGGGVYSYASGSGTSQLLVTGGLITGNAATGNGGGVYINRSRPTISGGTIAYNTATNNGGGVYASTFNATAISGAAIHHNDARANGGGLYLTSTATVTLRDLSISNNTASKAGGGVYHGCTKLVLAGMVRTTGNMVGGAANNVYLPAGKVLTLTNVLAGNSSVRVYTQNLPTDGSPIDVATATNSVWLSNSMAMFRSDRMGYSVTMPGAGLVLATGSGSHEGTEIIFDGILFQYYGVVTRPSGSGDNSRRLSVIDTTGGVLPRNGVSQTVRYLYLNEDGSVKMDTYMAEVYAAEDIAKDNLRPLGELNKFSGESDYYAPTQLWVAPYGDYAASTDPDDWTIYEWSDDLSLTTDEGEADDSTIYVDTGSVVRFVCDSVDGEKSINAIFYDYDISDGMIYGSAADAYNQSNGMPTSGQDERDTAGAKSFAHTYKAGINSDENYSDLGKSPLAFGQANGQMGRDTAKIGNYYFNRYNGGTNNFAGSSFGIVQGLDGDGHIVYNDAVSAPNLFDDGDAVGKTVIGGHSLGFVRSGDSYMLDSVSGTGVSGLSAFGHPGIYDGVQNKTVIWTNDFWPLDYMGTFGTDGHDFKFGDGGLLDCRRFLAAGTANEYTKSPSSISSDDGLDHNSYFGMQFAVEFMLDEDYVGPMDYYFFGDDDMWVFLDGRLVSDIGGVHSSVGIYTNLWDYLEKGEAGTHTLKFYFTERGASGSTCWMSFNIPHVMDATSQVVNFPGSLRIEKSVEGIQTRQAFEFDLTLDLSGAEGGIEMGEFAYIGSRSGTIRSGEAFTLADGEYIIIQNLPIGAYYSVRETGAAGYVSEATGAEGTIGNGQSAAAFVNTWVGTTGSLRVEKHVIGGSDPVDGTVDEVPIDPIGGAVQVQSDGWGNGSVLYGEPIGPFYFRIALTDGEGNAVEGTFEAETKAPTDQGPAYGMGPWTAGDTVALMGDGYIVIHGIPAGTLYSVEELDAEGYELASSEGASGTIELDGTAAAIFVNRRIQYTAEMPATGGHGTWFTMLLGADMAAAAYLLVRYRRRRIEGR